MAYSVPASNTLDGMILQDLDVVATTQSGDILGTEVTARNGRKFMYCVVHVGCVVTRLGGHPAYFIADTTGPMVTSDATEGTADDAGLVFAGLFTAAIVAATVQYVWIEVPNGAVTPDASVSTNVAVSSALAAIGTADQYLDVMVNGTSTRVIAMALEADTDQVADIIMFKNGGLSGTGA